MLRRLCGAALALVAILCVTRLAGAQEVSDAGAPTLPPPADEAPAVAPPPPPAPPTAPPLYLQPKANGSAEIQGFFDEPGLYVSGYLQVQYESHQQSEDQLLPGGTPANLDRFVLRRGRLRVDHVWSFAAVTLELDGSTTRGPIFGVRRGEVAAFYRGSQPKGEPPLVQLTAGLTQIPFGFELTDSPRNRLFMERSTGSLAFFPGEPDLGVRLSGGYKFLRYNVAVMNGEPVDDRAGGRSARDSNSAKDVVARLGIDTKPWDDFRVAGGISFLRGTGFHAGTDAQKNGTQWRDLNENGVVDNGEVSALPATAATPSVNFDRWGAALDLRLALTTSLGMSRLYGELTFASNLDRGLYVADPVASGIDKRELSYYLAAVQDLGKWGFVGFRVDGYNPDADFLDKRAGVLVPADATITTLSPLAGFTWADVLRLTIQYDHVIDDLGRDDRGVPTDLKNDAWTVRLQGAL